MRFSIFLLTASSILVATPALAAPDEPIMQGEDISLRIMANARVRYETVNQDNAAGNADALTARARIGAMIATGGLEVLAEGEFTGALADDYNDTLPGNGIEPFSVVADPENAELNRLQLSYSGSGYTGTLGRQRIIMGDARFVGNVGWRQNEQTFDALRFQARRGKVSFDGAYAISQRTIFGNDSPNEHFEGTFFLGNLGIDIGGVDVTGFVHILDYDTRVAFSSQTYGVRADVEIPLGATALKLSGTLATQDEAGANPGDYTAEFYAFSAGLGLAGFTLTAGYEELGSDGGMAAFQTPLATLHAFQGWADIFLVTPANGVRDYYATIRRPFTLPGVATFKAGVTYHQFDSDFGGLEYGSEWDASIGFDAGPVGILLKYANYDAGGFAVDTEKLWIQAQYSF